MSKSVQICYYCGQPASGNREHVPPFCFFPKGFRKELITVPSCREHNYLFKMDDEYVRNILSMGLNNSRVSRQLYFEKTVKSFDTNPGLVKKLNETMINVKLQNGSMTSAFGFDFKRFEKVMIKIGYGLYFKDNGKIWNTELNIYSPNLVSRKNLRAPFAKIFEKADKEYLWSRSSGENNDVFTYKWGRDNKDALILRLRFYTNFKVYLIPHLS